MSEKESGHRAAGGKPGEDPAELSRQMAEQMAEIAEKSRRLVADFLSRQGGQAGGDDGIGLSNPTAIGAAFFEMEEHLIGTEGNAGKMRLGRFHRFDVEIADANETGLAARHKIFKRAHGAFQRMVSRPVQQIEIEMISAETR